MMSGLMNAIIFLVNIGFNAYIFILILRLMLQKCRANYYNPVSQFAIKLTDPLVKPLGRFLKPVKNFDLSIIALIVVFQMIESLLLIFLQFSVMPHGGGLALFALGKLGNKVIHFYFFLIIVQAIISWVQSLSTHPAAQVIHLLCEPLLRPARKLIPPISGFDFSSWAVLILLLVVSMVIFNPLINAGVSYF